MEFKKIDLKLTYVNGSDLRLEADFQENKINRIKNILSYAIKEDNDFQIAINELSKK